MNNPSFPPPAANENYTPFLYADTALDELYRLRREMEIQDTAHHSFQSWQERKAALDKLDEAIHVCLSLF